MIVERPLTDGTIALLNLSAQIDAVELEVRLGLATVETRAGLVELLLLRGMIVGRIADYERAEGIAEQLVRDASADAKALLARARTRACFHRFNDALSDSIAPKSFRSMPKRPTASGRQSSRPSAATMKPSPCARKQQAGRRALKMSRPWSDCTPSGAKSRRQNSGTRKAAADTAAFRRFRSRFSPSRWDSCG